MSCHDCLLWVGRSYPTIAAYIKEAEKRGCCRQVPSWPKWIEPGRSRVFLAHHGDSTDPAQGVIFGYFVVAGVDVIVPPGCGPLNTPILINNRLRGWPVRPAPSVPSSPAPGGFVITTQQTELEEARDCPPDGLRLGPKKARGHRPSFYFVDRLERTIAERFRDWLGSQLRGLDGATKMRKLSDLRRVAGSAVRKRERQSGHPAFRQIVEAEARRKRARVPAELRGRATMHGALLVFDQPYPAFERHAAAAFRGLIRIDGDDLLSQIKRAQPSIEIPYCIPVEEGEELRQVGMIAKARHLTLSEANRLFSATRKPHATRA